MVSWIDRLTGKRQKPVESGFRPSVVSTGYQGQARPTAVLVNAQREILRSLAEEVIRSHGLPLLWLGFDVMTVSSQGKMVFQVQFTLKFWDEAIPLHFSALEASYMAKVASVDPELADLVRNVSWVISPEAGCPIDQMPEPSFWTEAARQERIAAKRRLELNQLFEDEWREDQRGGGFSATEAMGLPPDFAATQPFRASQ